MMESALYHGTVTHRRLNPITHTLRYGIFMMWLDLDELSALARRLHLFSHERFNLFSFHDCDHGDGQKGGLRRWVERHLHEAGLPIEGGAIRVLCMPRVAGHVFNPISVFFCHRPDGSLAAMIYEVNNTFGERHSYLIPVEGDGAVIRQVCEKRFYVSPFMPMEMRYRFRVMRPGARASLGITASEGTVPMIATGFAGARTALTDGALLRAFLRMPLLGAKVLAGIHWEALKLWVRGMKIQARPVAPVQPVTITR